MPTPDFDPFRFDDLLTPAQRRLRDQVREYMESVVRPAINDYWERAEMARDLALGLGKLPIPIIGGTLTGYGCAGLDNVSSGLVKYELCRVDGSVSTLFGVHSGLAISSIALLGSEEQKERWLPQMVAMEKLGAFGLTEPERGSDAAHVQATARRVGDDWVLWQCYFEKWTFTGQVSYLPSAADIEIRPTKKSWFLRDIAIASIGRMQAPSSLPHYSPPISSTNIWSSGAPPDGAPHALRKLRIHRDTALSLGWVKH